MKQGFFHTAFRLFDKLTGISKKDDTIRAIHTIDEHKFKQTMKKVEKANEILEETTGKKEGEK